MSRTQVTFLADSVHFRGQKWGKMSKISLRNHTRALEGQDVTPRGVCPPPWHPFATDFPRQEKPTFGPVFNLFSCLGAFLLDFSTLRRDSGCGTETDSQNKAFWDQFSEGGIMRKNSK